MTRETGSKAIQSVLSIDRFTEVSESQSIQPRKQGERKVALL